MRLDLFSKGDSVLLLGEGNLSFSVCLHKHKLPIKIVATCFESEARFEHQLDNIRYLESNEVPVFLNVDATKLRQNPHFSTQKFSKIVFNFPHVGGKMKIHLNRELLRNVFENSNQILTEDGLVIMSLCRGQGGTPADRPTRNWHDSWQVTEMAAHGDFALVAVEPFCPRNFTDYRCIGYRSRDVHFHLAGALVHVFAKMKPPYSSPGAALPATRLALLPLQPGSNLLVPSIYSELYQTNPLANPHSPISFLNHLLLENPAEWNILSDGDLPFHVPIPGGVPCRVNGVRRTLRATPFDIFPDFLKFLADENTPDKNTLFPGTYFSPLTSDFSNAPMQVYLTFTGKKLSGHVERVLKGLVDVFGKEDAVVSRRRVGGEREEWVVENGRSGERVEAGVVCRFEYGGMRGEMGVINAEGVCEYFFGVGWREVWADKTRVVVVGDAGRPMLRQGVLYPREYKLDVTLKYREEYTEERICELLWLAAGQLIEKVEMLSEYISTEGWSSKCYRLTYRSLDKPLFRKRVIDIHSKIVCRVLVLGLDVAIG